MEFRTDTVFEALKTPLGMVDDPERRAALERYVEAARLPLERAVFDLMAQVTAAVDERLGGRYHVRLAYRAGALELEVDEKESAEPITVADVEWARADGEMEKVTIRIPAELKELATQAATGAGLSVNSWFIRALAGAVRGAVRRGGASEEFGWHGPRDEERGRWPEQRERAREERHREREERRGRGSRLSGWIGNE